MQTMTNQNCHVIKTRVKMTPIPGDSTLQDLKRTDTCAFSDRKIYKHCAYLLNNPALSPPFYRPNLF